MKIYSRFQNLFMHLVLLFSVIAAAGTVYFFSTVSLGSASDKRVLYPIYFFLFLFVLLLCVSGIRFIYRNKENDLFQKLTVLVLFLLMALVHFYLMATIRVTPHTDLFDDIDTAGIFCITVL